MPRNLFHVSTPAISLSLALAFLSLASCMESSLADIKRTSDLIRQVDLLRVPGSPLESFDQGIVVDTSGIYALADRSNVSVDLFDTKSGLFVGRVAGFTGMGTSGGPLTSGPNGLVAVGANQIWAGDGDSSAKVIDVAGRKIIATISTGGSGRVDELAYDARDGLVIAANNSDKPPFVSFISTKEPYTVVGRMALKNASDGLEQPVWDGTDDLVYVAVPELDGRADRGGIAVIDPNSRQLIRMLFVDKCVPAGLALGVNHQLLVGCSDDAVAAGFAAKSLILDLPSGKVVAKIDKVGGADEVWFDQNAGRYYLAAVANTDGPVLGVIDARKDQWLANIPTGSRAHSVAADPVSGRVFVPIAPSGDKSPCPAGCIAVFGGP